MAARYLPITTFRHPALSLWQSALHQAITRRTAAAMAAGPAAAGLAATRDDPRMVATLGAVRGFVTGTPPSAALVASDLTTCAGLYVKLALAKFKARFTGDQSEVTYLENQISFSVCDPLWAEALVDYGEFLALGGTIPYVNYPPGEIGSFAVLDTLPDKPTVTVALLADWGTGMEDARALLTQVKAKNPDVVIHLGDIYYAGTAGEVQSNFLAVYGSVFGAPGAPGVPPLYTLSGNHDMYAGGAGYYGMLPALGQPASYFCLRNAGWQLLAMDTGLNDRDPFTVLTNLTYLNPPEVPWQQDKLVNAAGRKTILLSHHQLFSAFDSVGQDVDGRSLAWNPNLQAAFTRGGQSLLPQVAYWFWGHEHNLEVYQPYIGLACGRCIGAGAIPMLAADNPYTPAQGNTLPPGESALPQLIPNTMLANDGTVYDHCYAIVALAGKAATVTYYQDQVVIDSDGGLSLNESLVYTES
jgi:predicted phosphodiesterase